MCDLESIMIGMAPKSISNQAMHFHQLDDHLFPSFYSLYLNYCMVRPIAIGSGLFCSLLGCYVHTYALKLTFYIGWNYIIIRSLPRS